MKTKKSHFEDVVADAAMRAIRKFAAILHRDAPDMSVETLESCLYWNVRDGKTDISEIHEALVREAMIRPAEERLH
jgi:hypothetical protein